MLPPTLRTNCTSSAPRPFSEPNHPSWFRGPVIAEVCYLLVRAGGPGAETPFLRSFHNGFLTLVDLAPEDLVRAADLVERDADLPLDAADAYTVALAERLDVGDVITIDNDFRVVRPAHVRRFQSRRRSRPNNRISFLLSRLGLGISTSFGLDD